jgi:FkbM family methyltransferase
MISTFIARVLNRTGLIHRYGRVDLLPVSKINTTSRIKINDDIFKVPILSKTGWENLFLTEGWFTGLLKSLNARKDWTVIDIGANIGQTLLKLKSIDREIKYFGFEPNPVCINYLYKLIERNKFPNTVIFPAGVSNKTNLTSFYYYSDSDADPSASIIQEYRPDSGIRRRNIVPVFDINEVSEIIKVSKIDLIKIDVEGAELEVLLSCQGVIEKFKPFIVIEILPVYTTNNFIRKERQDKIEKLVKSLNYKILLIKKGKKETFDTLEEKDFIGIHGDILNIDYLLMPVK